jgi:diaminopimelate decarboxylase
MRTEELITRYFSASDQELHIGGVPVSAIVTQHGTPLFAYDGAILEQKYTLLRETLPAVIGISYSVKANPNLALLRFFLQQGCGLEIASGGEFCQARQAGCPPEKILFAGPGKTETELAMVVAQNIGEIHAESAGELRRIARISRGLGKRTPVAVRVNPSQEAQGGAMRMGGKPAPFGVDEETLDSVLDILLSESSLEFRGIHLFSGTQILDYTILLSQYRKALDIAARTARRLGRALYTVDFGGGLGVPYFPHEQELDMLQLRRGLSSLMDSVRDSHLFKETRFVVEPGRYLVAEAGVYVTRVIDVKTSRGKKFVILDGGMHHHLAASGNLGQTIKRNYPVAILNRLQTSTREEIDLVGPLCTPLDVLAREVTLPAAEVGDLVGIFQSGAYARTASPLGFLSHPTPPEVLVDKGQFRLIRARGANADYFDQPCSASVW